MTSSTAARSPFPRGEGFCSVLFGKICERVKVSLLIAIPIAFPSGEGVTVGDG